MKLNDNDKLFIADFFVCILLTTVGSCIFGITIYLVSEDISDVKSMIIFGLSIGILKAFIMTVNYLIKAEPYGDKQ